MTRSKSPIRKGIKVGGSSPKRANMRRVGTMEATAGEALQFLQQSGDKNLLETSSTLPETRGRTKAREVISDMLNDSTKVIKLESLLCRC